MSLGGWSNQTEDAIEVTERSLPATLENRGLALPFTTPPVAYSRIRFGDKGLEIILPGFKKELLANVIPFAKLPEIVSLTVFDRAFHEALEDTLTTEGPSALTPALIRKLATNIGETGLGGAEIMRRARSRKVIFANMEPAILNHLTSELISAYARDQDPNLNMATAESQKLAALALEGFGQDFGIDGATVVERLKEISIFMANYRGPTKGMNGPVNDIISRLKLLAGDLRQWLIPEPVEEAEMAQRTALTAEAFVRATEPYTDNLDEVYDNIDRTIAQWDSMAPRMKHIFTRLELLIDGWERILDARDMSAHAQRFVQREVLSSFAPFVPVMAKDVIQPDEMHKWLDLRTAQLRWLGRISYMKDMKDEAEVVLSATKMEVL